MIHLKNFSDFIKYSIVPKPTCVSLRSKFKGWNALRTMPEHQLILLLEGSGYIFINGEKHFANTGDLIYLPPECIYGQLRPEKCSSIELILVQFSYLLVENNDIHWAFDTAKNFAVMKDSDLQWHIHTENAPLPFDPVQKMVNFFKVKSFFFEMYDLEMTTPIAYKWQEQFLLSQLLYETAKNFFFYHKNQNHIHLINWVIKYFSVHYQENISLDEIIESVGMSKSHFIRLFRQYTDHTPMDYLNLYRIEKAKALLFQSDLSVKEISFKMGFNDEFYFSRLFKKHVGISPLNYRKYQKSLINLKSENINPKSP